MPSCFIPHPNGPLATADTLPTLAFFRLGVLNPQRVILWVLYLPGLLRSLAAALPDIDFSSADSDSAEAKAVEASHAS